MLITFDSQEEKIIDNVVNYLNKQNFEIIKNKNLSVQRKFLGLEIDIIQRKVSLDNRGLSLTKHEYDLLCYLSGQPGRVFTKEQIYSAIYHDFLEINVANTIYCLVKGIRKKLEHNQKQIKYIHTVHGVGYKFEPLSEE